MRRQDDWFDSGVLFEKITQRQELRVAVDENVRMVSQKTINGVGEIPRRLPDPRAIRSRGHAGDLDSSGLEVHDNEDIHRHESTERPNFRRCEVDGGKRVPMGPQERTPRYLPLPFWRGFDPIQLQDVANRLITDRMDEIGQSALNAVIAPGRIFFRKPEDETDDRLVNTRPADGLPLVAVVPLLRHEFTVPTQNRVRGHDGGQFEECLAAENMRFHSQYPTLVVAQQQPLLAELVQQGVDLCVLELDDLLLAFVGPAAEDGEQDVPRLEDECHASSIAGRNGRQLPERNALNQGTK